MSNQLENLYSYLVEKRKSALQGWSGAYQEFIDEIQTIKQRLSETHNDIRHADTYKGTSFEKYANETHSAYDLFVKKLLYNKSNGISSRGQSTLSNAEMTKFKETSGFDKVLSDLILTPNEESYKALGKFWKDTKGSKNPVLVNRAIAACTLDVTSTVDEGKFNQVFSWLQGQEVIDAYKSDRQDWYNKNIFIVEQFREKLSTIDDVNNWLSQFYWQIYQYMSDPFSLKKQVVKYGAPGTGKTYQAKETAEVRFNIWKSELGKSTGTKLEDVMDTVQFHPSYSYEDFLEGLRPDLDGKLRLENGIFKNMCIDAGRWEVDVANLDPELKFDELKVGDLLVHKDKLVGEYWGYVFEQGEDKKVVDIVPPYFLIIDEINRAELSRVFGELMYCLEYRGIKGRLKTQYAQLNSESTSMIELGNSHQFFVPNNLYILATMNTVDRSVESFDFALRRRFKWEEVEPDTELLRYHLNKHNKGWVDLATNLESLNEKIEKENLLGKDYCIGHAYLWNLPYPKELSMTEVRRLIWKDSLSSLLEEYLRGTGRADVLKTLSKSFGIA